MSSQYDSIGARYNSLKQYPVSVMERENMKQTVLPYLTKINKPRVLDLACGTGFYSQYLVQWGAAYVYGVDLSSAMVDVARQTITDEQREKGVLRFEVGDVATLGKIQNEAAFDMVTGSWLLNYSADVEEMARMFKTISENLKDGGVFVGTVPHPTEDVDAYAQLGNDGFEANLEKLRIAVKYHDKLASGDGWRTEVVGRDGEKTVAFFNFHLKKSLFEVAARNGGMNGRFTWIDPIVPQEALDMTKEWAGYWDSFRDFHLGVVVVEK